MQRKDPVRATAARATVSVNPAVRRKRVAAVRNAMRRRKMELARFSAGKD